MTPYEAVFKQKPAYPTISSVVNTIIKEESDSIDPDQFFNAVDNPFHDTSEFLSPHNWLSFMSTPTTRATTASRTSFTSRTPIVSSLLATASMLPKPKKRITQTSISPSR